MNHSKNINNLLANLVDQFHIKLSKIYLEFIDDTTMHIRCLFNT